MIVALVFAAKVAPETLQLEGIVMEPSESICMEVASVADALPRLYVTPLIVASDMLLSVDPTYTGEPLTEETTEVVVLSFPVTVKVAPAELEVSIGI